MARLSQSFRLCQASKPTKSSGTTSSALNTDPNAMTSAGVPLK